VAQSRSYSQGFIAGIQAFEDLERMIRVSLDDVERSEGADVLVYLITQAESSLFALARS
jgi:hypothetical protein